MVIIIIGILAAIAIPVFLNQRQRANDATMISNTKGVANAIQESLVDYPNARYIVVFDNNDPLPPMSASFNITDADGDGKVSIGVGNNVSDANFTEVPVNEGWTANLHTVGLPQGEYRLRAWNPNGKEYVDAATGYLYQTNAGGFVPGG